MAGNANSGKRQDKIWRDTLNLEANRIDEKTGEKQIALAAKQLMQKVLSGDVQALKEFGDRMDGKPAQAIIGDSDNPVKVTFEWNQAQPKES